MRGMKGVVAALAVASILGLGAVVAFAAPASVVKTASPRGGAALAVYCPPGERDRRKHDHDRYEHGMKSARDAYFRTHKSAKDRDAFVARQNATERQLRHDVERCDNDDNDHGKKKKK